MGHFGISQNVKNIKIELKDSSAKRSKAKQSDDVCMLIRKHELDLELIMLKFTVNCDFKI